MLTMPARVAGAVGVAPTGKARLYPVDIGGGVIRWYYRTASGAEGDLVAGVSSFNGRAGSVSPIAADYDSFFLTPAEGAAAYDPIGAAATKVASVGATAPVASSGGLTPVISMAVASASNDGYMAAAMVAVQTNFKKGWVNLNDFGVTSASSTSAVATALAAAQTALTNGGVIFLTELFPIGGNFTITRAGLRFLGADPNNCGFTTNAATGNMFTVNEWFVEFENIMFATSVNRTAGFCVDAPDTGGYAYTKIIRCKFYGTASLRMWDCVNLSTTLSDMDYCEARFFASRYITVDGQSDHRITGCVCDNAVQAVAGINVIKTASLLLANNNIIHAGKSLWVTPNNGGTIPSIKGLNTFLDNGTHGICFEPVGTGVWYRSQFTNCWGSSNSVSGVHFGSPQFDGIDFVACDFLGNGVAGIDANSGGGKWGATRCRIAGNATAGVRLAASASHSPMLTANQIGSAAAFGVNGTGIIVGAGTYTGLIIQGNDCVDNTTVLSLGAVTVANWARYRILDNPGINPRGAVTIPAVPAAGVTVTNTTGFRVTIGCKNGATAPASIIVNGVTMPTTSYNTVVTTGANVFVLDPGGTISFTTTTIAAGWSWVAN